MKYGCRNQEDEISLECTDLRRGVLKYMTVDGDVKHINTWMYLNFLKLRNVKLLGTI